MAQAIHKGSDEHKAYLASIEPAKKPAAVAPEVDPKSGPTVEEYVKSGYDPKNYPPAGYESKSTAKQIEKAIAEYNKTKE